MQHIRLVYLFQAHPLRGSWSGRAAGTRTVGCGTLRPGRHMLLMLRPDGADSTGMVDMQHLDQNRASSSKPGCKQGSAAVAATSLAPLLCAAWLPCVSPEVPVKEVKNWQNATTGTPSDAALPASYCQLAPT